MELEQLDSVWAGTEQGLHMHIENIKLIAKMIAERGIPQGTDMRPVASISEDGEGSYLMQVLGGTAMITIYGPIKAQASWYDKYFGIPSYPAINDALVHAGNNGKVKRVVLNLHTPGGQTSGIYETSSLIEMVSRKKSVIAVATGDMASAGYWLGCSADMIVVSPTSLVGSIGVAAVTVDQSEALSKAGVKVRVFRSGEYKMKPHSAEALDKQGIENTQAMVDSLDALFVSHVARRRGLPESTLKETVGNGRIFVGAESVANRLADAVASLNDTLALAEQGKFDKVTDGSHNTSSFLT